MIEWLSYFFSHNLHIYTWRDGCEIACISFFLYVFIRWLWSDTSYRPLKVFYSYCCGLFLAVFLQLPLLVVILLIGLPLVGITLLLVHQETLQKNFITLKSYEITKDKEFSWLHELMKSCLSVLNKQYEIIGVIQKTDDLKGYLEAPYYLHADVEHHIITMLLEHGVSGDGFVWLSHGGKIIAINALLRHHVTQQWVSSEVQSLPLWKQDAIFLTSKTDALVFHINKHTRLFECISNGKISNELTAHHALLFMKRHLSEIPHGGNYENFTIPTHHEQSPHT